MKVFVVLLAISEDFEKSQADYLESIKFNIGGSVQATESDVKQAVIDALGNFDPNGVTVYQLHEFKEFMNGGENSLDDSWLTYVYTNS